MTHLSFSPLSKVWLLFILFSVSLNTISKSQSQCDLKAKAETQVSLCYQSTLEVTPDMVIEPIASTCQVDLVVDILVNGNSIGNVVTYNYAGQTLDIVVTDRIANKSSNGKIKVQGDDKKPTAVCDEFTVTSLSAESGSAVLCADNFDSGSYDNCFLASIKIRRMDEPFFKDCIRVDCDDVGAPVMIVLRATDYEGFTDDCMIELSVHEKVAPMIECAEDITVDCQTDINAPNFYAPFAMDNCGTPTVTYVDDDQRNDCGVGIVTRTFTAEDKAGNTSTCVQIITLEQNKTPLIFFPSDRVLDNCEDAFNTEVSGEPVLHDYCSNLLVSHKDQIFRSEDNCSFKVFREWSILDWCSFEEKLDTQIIKVFDKQAPTFTTTPGSLDGDFECADDVVFTAPEATDDCSDVTVSIDSDEIIPGDCPNKFTRVISYIATDDCGNVSEPFIITINVNDTTAPTSDPLPNIGPFQCYDDRPSANPDDVTGEADNCGGVVTVTFIGDSPDPGCSGFVTRTYQLADECNNTTIVTQQIEIKDDTAPTTNPLPDLGPFACFPELPEPDVNIVEAVDNCGDPVTVTHVGDSPFPGCEGVVVRTYRMTDVCGNSADVTQNLIVKDDVAPTADALPDLGPFNCYEDRPAANITDVNASDNCGQPVDVQFVNDTPDPGCEGTVTRTYLLTDACGNTTTVTQNISIDDKVAPTADALPDLGPFTCISEVPAADINVVTGEMDNCDGTVTVTFDSDETAPECQGSYLRIYTLSDECGNTSQITQRISINDDVAPTADALPDLGPFACLADVPAPDVNILSGLNDNCGSVNVTHVGDTAPPDCSGAVVRTYRLTDDCGNTTDIVQQISLNDDVPPMAEDLPDLGPFACFADLPAPDVSIVQGTDNCGDAVTVTHMGDTDDPGCEGIVVRTYQVTDFCDNSIIVAQNLIIRDDVAPTAEELNPIGSIQCYADRPAADISIVNATDNCGGNVTVSFIGDSEDPGCTGTVIRTYRLMDECGNSADIQQSILIDDTTPPTADPIAAIGPFLCVSDVPDPDISIVTGLQDNCGREVTVTFDREEAAPNCQGFYKRFYLITDDCGNSAEVMQEIEINDNIMPTADALPNIGPFQCLADAPAPDVETVTGEADNCGDVNVTFVGDTGDIVCTGVVTRTYRVTDGCGNAIDVTQLITINDNTPPTANPLADAGPFDCATKIPPVNIEDVTGASDNCGAAVIVEHVGDSEAPLCTGTITRTYRVSDECGNSIELTQNFTIEDNIPPTADPLTEGPFECYEDLPSTDETPFFNAVDNCTGTIRITFIGPDTGDPGCTGEVIRRWRLRDECGNTSIVLQTLLIEDTTPPTADPLPPLGTFSCLSDVPVPDSTLVMNEMDNCGDTVFVNFLTDLPGEGNCPDTLTRVYQISDMCGNTDQVTQQFIINDEEAPVVTPLANLGTFACFDDLPAPDITAVQATDNCPDDLIVEFVGDSGDPGCTGTVRRFFTVTDRCGNVSNLTQDATILDDVPPTLTCPRDVTEPIFSNAIGDCQAPVTLIATAIDNCNTDVEITNDSQFSDDPTIGADASGSYPLGVTFVKFTATDACGNTDECTVRIEVIDIESPTLTCTTVRKDIGIDPITGDTIAVLTVEDITIRGEVFDFCTPITTTFLKDTFTCADLLTTPNPYTLTAVDTFGNMNTCSPNNGIFLRDPLGLCGPTPPPAIVGGRIASAITDDQIEGVMIYANESTEMMSMSDGEGNYLISNLVPNTDYMIRPEKNDDLLNGVSTLDMVQISQYILGTRGFDSPYQLLAADVDKSNSISVSDLVAIRQAILGKINAFPNNNSWRFFDRGFQMLNPDNPFGESLPEEMMLNDMNSDQLGIDFMGFKVGDVTGDAKYNEKVNPRSATPLNTTEIAIEDQTLEGGQEYEIDFRVKDFANVLGYQFTLNFDSHVLELLDVVPGTVQGISEDNFNIENSQQGSIATNFVQQGNILLEDDAILFTLKFKAYAKYQLSEILSISSDLLNAEGYTQEGNEIMTTQPKLVFSESDNKTITIIENDFKLYQNRPNPFNNQTVIGFDLPQNAAVSFQVYDLSGKQLQVIKGEYLKGYNEIRLDAYKLPISGIFYYRLDTPFGSATRKMVLVE